jgi:hypothetical protein
MWRRAFSGRERERRDSTIAARGSEKNSNPWKVM